MALELVHGARGDVRNAAFLAVASDLAYLPEAAGAPAFLQKLGRQ